VLQVGHLSAINKDAAASQSVWVDDPSRSHRVGDTMLSELFHLSSSSSRSRLLVPLTLLKLGNQKDKEGQQHTDGENLPAAEGEQDKRNTFSLLFFFVHIGKFVYKPL
jgi:hypothetical protein